MVPQVCEEWHPLNALLQVWDQLLFPNTRMFQRLAKKKKKGWPKSGSSNVDHAEPTQPINNTDNTLEEKEHWIRTKQGCEMKVGGKHRSFSVGVCAFFDL